MPYARQSRIRDSRIALSVIAAALVVAAPAAAQTRTGAPIVFRSTSPATAQAPAQPVQAPYAAPADKATAKIDFRYPNSAAAPGQVRMASTTMAPVASNGQDMARTQAPQMVAPPKSQPTFESSSLQPVAPMAGQGSAYAAPAPAPAPAPATASSGDYIETGVAVLYGEEYAGLPTANGEIFTQSAMTAAHPTLPLPSLVHVTNLQTGREVVVRVNDRGPFEDDANVQLSRQAGEALGFNGAGRGNVQLRYLGPAPVLNTQAALPATSAPVSAPAPAYVPASTPVSAPAAEPEDELLGGAPASPRLMSMTVAPAQPAYSAPVAATGAHYVQLAAFTDLGNAEAMLRQVRGDLPVEIVQARVHGADFFRVRVGPFSDHTAAEQVRNRLSMMGTADGRVVTDN